MSDEIVEATVVKSGETCIQTSLSRHPEGLKINVWAHPRVEDFVRSLGTGEHVDVQTIGRYWTRPNVRDEKGRSVADERRLLVYSMSQDLGSLMYDNSHSYSLQKPGHPLLEDTGGLDLEGALVAPKGYRKESLNMSFLRLVGISDGPGVSFAIRGVYSRGAINKLGEAIEQASNRFYREFLKPYKLIVTVSTMPITGDY